MEPDFSRETKLNCTVAGIDEVGRGPWAGPVVAAAVILDPGHTPIGLNDSKKLSPKKRLILNDAIKASAIWALGIVDVGEIDDINILQASLLAMRRAVSALSRQPGYCLVDGNKDPNLSIPTDCIIKGDGKSSSIAAASIIAKVFRDEYMTKLSQSYPAYGWEKNAGYGVPHHMEALRLVGISPHHRKSFKPIAKILNEDSSLTS
jgi:ribonuclease HII